MKTLLIMAVVLSAVLDLLLPIEWVSMIFLSLEAVDATMRVFRYAAASTIPFLLIGVCRFFSVDVLTRLMRGLETKKTLYHVKDYPGVELKQLNHYVKKLGPLVNPVFDEQSAFFIDEGRFIPYRMVVYGNEKVAAEIGAQLRNWSKCSGEGVRVTTS
ncbi:hypothetical protein JG687_00008613 [Phytophthora cactorum]|nr:hypothetical protein JG687_00008613 [Phytophthora cactorum]